MDQEQDLDARVDQSAQATTTGSTAQITPGDAPTLLTEEEIAERTLVIIRLLYDLKEDVIFRSKCQPDFDGGLLAAALLILEENYNGDLEEEKKRQMNDRLWRAIRKGCDGHQQTPKEEASTASEERRNQASTPSWADGFSSAQATPRSTDRAETPVVAAAATERTSEPLSAGDPARSRRGPQRGEHGKRLRKI